MLNPSTRNCSRTRPWIGKRPEDRHVAGGESRTPELVAAGGSVSLLGDVCPGGGIVVRLIHPVTEARHFADEIRRLQLLRLEAARSGHSQKSRTRRGTAVWRGVRMNDGRPAESVNDSATGTSQRNSGPASNTTPRTARRLPRMA